MANKVVKRQYIIDTKTNAAEQLLKSTFKWKGVTLTASELFKLCFFSDFNIIDALHRLGVISDEEYNDSEFVKREKAEIEEILKKLGL